MNVRPLTLLALFALVGAAFAGCVGEEEPATPASTDGDKTPPLGEVIDPVTGELTILKPLQVSVKTAAAKWVAPGTTIDLAATTSGASGAVTYAWAIGALPDTVAVTTALPNTGEIMPGASKSVKFTAAGTFEAHCHPHPFMLHNVTVIDGYAGPDKVEVAIVDGKTLGEYLYVPRDIVIAKNTEVTYVNKGSQMHTATVAKANPALKKIAIAGASGSVAVDGDGWQQIVVAATDAKGAVGITSMPIYVKPLPAPETTPVTIDMNVGKRGAVPGEAQPDQTVPLSFAQNGVATIEWSVADPVSSTGAGTVPPEANTAKIEWHLVENGGTQDTMTGASSASGTATGKVAAKPYVLTIVPVEGAKITGTLTITVVFEDPVPPAPAKVGGGDGHGDHAGH